MRFEEGTSPGANLLKSTKSNLMSDATLQVLQGSIAYVHSALGFRSTLRFYKHQKLLMVTSLVPEQLDRKYATNIAASSRFRTILGSAQP